MLAEAKALNRTGLGRRYAEDYQAIVDALDALHSIAAFHSWTFDGWIDAVPHPAHPVLFSCFHKTLLSIHTANELTFDGLYGVARPHLRQAFESLVIAKFCGTAPDADIFDKWIDGLDLYFSNGILKKIQSPSTEQISHAWGLLCKWSHATVFANQLTLDLETTSKETTLNLAFISVLLEFTFHVLNRHLLTTTIKYYAKRYGDDESDAPHRNRLKASLELLRKDLGPGSRRLIRDFRATWTIKA
jgi:hypothetical protein